MSNLIHLWDERWRVVVAPAHGGALQCCELDGAPLLQPAAAPQTDDSTQPARCYFPMIPFSNRIENSEFRFAGSTVRLRSNVPGAAHAMHGHGWQSVWTVRSATPLACSLAYVHEADAEWPWRYEGSQSFAIAGDALRITLGIRNLSDGAMPCGLGFHPFFPAHPGARLQLRAARVWNGSAHEFPRGSIAVPRPLCFDAGVRVADRVGIDHCYEGWHGRAAVSYEASSHDILIEADAATGFLVIYIPERGDYLCVEPVTHAVNAMNLADPAATGWWTLQPGESREIAMTVSRRNGKAHARAS